MKVHDPVVMVGWEGYNLVNKNHLHGPKRQIKQHMQEQTMHIKTKHQGPCKSMDD